MTTHTCDLCGRVLPIAPNRVAVCEFKADACDACANRLIDKIREMPYKPILDKAK
jgi:hypothetical protein